MKLDKISKKSLFVVCLLILIFLSSGAFSIWYRAREIVLPGYIEGKYAYLSSAVSGTLLKLLVDRGTIVKKGQILFILDPEPEYFQVKKAQAQLLKDQQIYADLQKGQRNTIITALNAQLSQAKANFDLAKLTWQRYQKLYLTRTIDRASLDQALASYRSTGEKLKEIEANLNEANLGARENLIAAQREQVLASEAEVRRLNWQWQQKTVSSPNQAIIFDTLKQPGEFIPSGEPVIALLAKETLKVVFFIPEEYLATIHLGQSIFFECDYGSKETRRFRAVINFISPKVEFTPPVLFSRESRSKLVYRVEAKIDDQIRDRFNTGQPVDVIVKL